MMRLWGTSYARPTPVLTSATLSLVVHAVIIGTWIITTQPAPGVPPESLANHPFFVPPPDRSPTQSGSHEAVQYVTLAPEGLGSGEGPRMMGEARPIASDETAAKKGTDSVTAPEIPATSGPDSVYSILEVDTAVVRSANSAAPAYPLKLLNAHIMGSVSARYVVDTTGFADTSSFNVLSATNPEFVTAVKEALPYMRFQPAKIGGMKVRQLVEQQFSFKITDSTTAAPPKKKP
jgi:hypothetical protein